MFNPSDVADMVHTIGAVWDSAERRAATAQQGTARVERLTWNQTALRYRALYRQLSGRDTSQDQAILACRPPC
ncbi:hypothetical protein BH24ACT15_BH24ACT15_36200 [soil metagenome]